MATDKNAKLTTVYEESNLTEVMKQIAAARNDAYAAIADNEDGCSHKLDRIQQSPLLPTKVGKISLSCLYTYLGLSYS